MGAFIVFSSDSVAGSDEIQRLKKELSDTQKQVRDAAAARQRQSSADPVRSSTAARRGSTRRADSVDDLDEVRILIASQQWSNCSIITKGGRERIEALEARKGVRGYVAVWGDLSVP